MLITQILVPEYKWDIKCPYQMKPEGITIHNTANDASARNEINYMIGNNNKVSYHYAVDDYEAVQGVLEDRNTWNAGDGRGFGNMKTISIEICYSKSGGDRFHKAEENAAELTAILMIKYGWGKDAIGTKAINTHQSRSGKYCPHRTLDEGIDRFWGMVAEKYDQLMGVKDEPVQPIKEDTERHIGDIVEINGVFASSTSTKKLNPLVKTGTITKIVNARNPYLLDNGNIGWVNEEVIVKEESQPNSEPEPTPQPVLKSVDEIAREVIEGKWGVGNDRKNRLTDAGYNYSEVQARVNEIVKYGQQPKVDDGIKVGDTVRVRQNARDYNGTRLISSVYNNNYSVKQIKGDRVVITRKGIVIAAMHKADLYKV